MERQIADMTLRLLAGSGESRVGHHPYATSTRSGSSPSSLNRRSTDSARSGPRLMPYDPIFDRDEDVENVSKQGNARLYDESSRQLTSLPIRRAWRSKAGGGNAEVSRGVGTDAVMVYERGQVQGAGQQCSRCQRGHGISAECVKIDGFRQGACSNCLAARTLSASGAAIANDTSREYSPARQYISASVPPNATQEDLVAVWNVIVQVLSRQSQDCATNDEVSPPSRRIEDAALLVARSADEWGHNVEDESRGAHKSDAERRKLVTQGIRIRETALHIARRAKRWGEKSAAQRPAPST